MLASGMSPRISPSSQNNCNNLHKFDEHPFDRLLPLEGRQDNKRLGIVSEGIELPVVWFVSSLSEFCHRSSE